jgi:hypothetical protein
MSPVLTDKSLTDQRQLSRPVVLPQPKTLLLQPLFFVKIKAVSVKYWTKPLLLFRRHRLHQFNHCLGLGILL